MSALFVKYLLSIVTSVLLIFTPFITAWQHLLAGITLGLILLFFGLSATSYTIVRKHRDAWQQGKNSLSTSKRNICFEIAAVLSAMILAGVGSRYISRPAMENMGGDMQQYLTGIGLGLLVGWSVGLLLRHVAGRLVKS